MARRDIYRSIFFSGLPQSQKKVNLIQFNYSILTCVALIRDVLQSRPQAPVVAGPDRLSGRAVDIVRRSGANKRDSVTVIESRGN